MNPDKSQFNNGTISPASAARAQRQAELDKMANAPYLGQIIKNKVSGMFKGKGKKEAAKPAPVAAKPAAQPVRKQVDPGKPVNEKNPITEPIDLISDGDVELIPPVPSAKKKK